MKTSSCKAKGRKLCAEIKEMILSHHPELAPDDVMVTPSGVTGEDLHLSPKARLSLPYTIEAKNQQSFSIWACLKQAESHAEGRDLTPLLIFRRNHASTYVALKLEDFIKLNKKAHT